MKTKLLTLVISLLISTNLLAEDITIKVNGMVCSFCAQGIKKNFESISSVKEVTADLETKTVVVKTKDDTTLKDAEVKKVINDAGYQVVSIERVK